MRERLFACPDWKTVPWRQLPRRESRARRPPQRRLSRGSGSLQAGTLPLGGSFSVTFGDSFPGGRAGPDALRRSAFQGGPGHSRRVHCPAAVASQSPLAAASPAGEQGLTSSAGAPFKGVRGTLSAGKRPPAHPKTPLPACGEGLGVGFPYFMGRSFPQSCRRCDPPPSTGDPSPDTPRSASHTH